MNYKQRLALLMALDSMMIVFIVFIAFWIAYPYSLHVYDRTDMIVMAVALLIFHHIFAIIYKLYNKVWAYASVGEVAAIVKSVTLTILAVAVVQLLFNQGIYKRPLFITWMLSIITFGGSRLAWRVFRDRYIKSATRGVRTLIVGAGDAGAMIARQLNTEHNTSNLRPIAFVDDDVNKQRMEMYNVPVVGKVKDIPDIVASMDIAHIVIAIPSLQNGELRTIVDYCKKTRVKVQMIPKIEDLMTGRVSVSNLKNVDVEDLLGRQPVKLDISSIKDTITGQTIMVTGAGGSIGSELCRQLMRFAPRKILLVGHGEFSIYTIERELRTRHGDSVEIIPIIADVKDRQRMFDLMDEYEPKNVYHAAAHKHVPLMEYNAHEAVKNNVLGTKNVAEAAAGHNVDTFVLVSTDKAVNPTNVMGATKRIAEMIIQGLNKNNNTKFAAVRFGNVLGSRGSVIPLFKQQIENGGPVTVTDPEMTRYFMTIPEASRLVIQAGTLAAGGEIFVLDMGEPVKITELAKNLIHLSGYSEEDIQIRYTGLRPGEKMYEELLNENEVLPGQVFEKIYVGRTAEVDPAQIQTMIDTFDTYHRRALKEALMDIVYMERQMTAVGE